MRIDKTKLGKMIWIGVFALALGLFSAGTAAACTPGTINNLQVVAGTPHCYTIFWSPDACAVKYQYTLKPGGYVNVTIDLDTTNHYLSVGAPDHGTSTSFKVRGVGPNGELGPYSEISFQRSNDHSEMSSGLPEVEGEAAACHEQVDASATSSGFPAVSGR